jgi:hypothetical protein
MSTPRYTAADFAKVLDPLTRRLAGMLRRVGIDTTKITRVPGWKVLGYLLPDGKRESFTAEVFPGIGFYARPPAGARAEAVVQMIHGADNPVIVATRDERTRADVAGGIAEDETMLHNSESVLYIKADGSIEARTAGGTATKLPTWDDFEALWNFVRSQFSAASGHVHQVSGSATTTIATVATPGTPPAPGPLLTPTGTTKFKAE